MKPIKIIKELNETAYPDEVPEELNKRWDEAYKKGLAAGISEDKLNDRSGYVDYDEELSYEEETERFEKYVDDLISKGTGLYKELFNKDVDYTDVRRFITGLRSISAKADIDGFNFVDELNKAIDGLSKVYSDLEDFYESQK